MIRADHQFRGAVDRAAVDHDPIAGARRDQETCLLLGKRRPKPWGAPHTLARLDHMIPPDVGDGSALSPDVLRSLPDMLAVLRARINARSHRASQFIGTLLGWFSSSMDASLLRDIKKMDT